MTAGYFIDRDGNMRRVADPGGGYRCEVDTVARYVGVATSGGAPVHEATFCRSLEDVARAGAPRPPWHPAASHGASALRGDRHARRGPVGSMGVPPAEALGHRNTCFRAHYDAQDRMLRCEKRVYGEAELSHHDEYDAGRLQRAVITVGDDELRMLHLPPHRAGP